MLQKVTRLDSVPTAEETVLTTEVPTKESRLYTLLLNTDPISGSLTLFILMEHLIHISTIGSMVWDSPLCD